MMHTANLPTYVGGNTTSLWEFCHPPRDFFKQIRAVCPSPYPSHRVSSKQFTWNPAIKTESGKMELERSWFQAADIILGGTLKDSTINMDAVIRSRVTDLGYTVMFKMLGHRYIFSEPEVQIEQDYPRDGLDVRVTVQLGTAPDNGYVDAMIAELWSIMNKAEYELFLPTIHSFYARHSQHYNMHLLQLEHELQKIDITRFPGQQLTFELMCRIRGLITGELR